MSNKIISGALFDFMGWLTSRPKRIMLSSADDASPAVDAIKDFAKMRGLSLDDARVKDWQEALTSVPDWASEAIEQPAPVAQPRKQEPAAYMYASIAGPVILHRLEQIGVAKAWCVEAQLANDMKAAKRYPKAHSCTPLYTTPQPAQQQEPVAYGMWDTMLGKGNRMMMVRLDRGQDGCTVPLYTSPPAQHVTDEQVDAALKAAHMHSTPESRKDMRQAIKAAHNIKENT